MTRTLYAGRIGDTVASLYQAGDGRGRVFLAVPSDAQGYPTPVVFTVWDEPDGTQLDNLLAADGTTPITQVVVPASEIQVPGFYGPDGVSADVWLKDPAGAFFRMDASPDAAAADAVAAKDAALAAAASVPGMWQPSTVYTAGSIKVAPDGSTLSRLANGTSRPSFDSTEKALWQSVLSKPGTIEQTDLTTSYASKLDNASTSSNGALTIEKLTKVDASGAARSMTIPDGTIKGQQAAVEKTDTSTNLVTVTGKIRSTGSSSITLTYQYETLVLVWGGTFWEPLAGHRTKTSIDTQAINRTTRPKHAPALGLFFPEAEGAVGDGSTNDTAAIIAADTAAQANGSGIVYFDSNKTYRCDGRLARTFAGTTGTPTSKPVRWTSSGASSASGQWVANPLNGGATLDLRYDGTDGLGQAKIDTRGCGRFEIDHLNLISGGTDNFPFLQTTNTTVHAHHNFVRGNSANQQGTAQQDVFIFGGTDSTLGDGLNAPFQGYGSKVHDNHFDRIRRGFVGRLYCNSVLVKDNVFSTRCGNDGTTGTTTMGGAIEFLGNSSGSGYCTGNIVTGNTIEIPYYKHALASTYAQGNTFGPNGLWDAQAGSGTAHVAGYFMDTGSIYNTIVDGWHNSAYPLVLDKGMTNTVRTPAQARGSFYPQNSFYRGRVHYVGNGSSGVGPSIFAREGDYAAMRCSAGTAGTPSYPTVTLCTSPGLTVTDGVTTTGATANVFTSATAAFVPEMKYMPISGAGIPNNTLITRYISATQVEMSADATVAATGVTAVIGKAPGTGTLTDEVSFTRRHLVAKGAIGTASPQTAAGGGATATATGKDLAFALSLTTGTSGLTTGALVTVTWGITYTGSAAIAVVTPTNAAAAHAMAANELYASTTNSNFTLSCGTGTLATSTTMTFAVHVIQA